MLGVAANFRYIFPAILGILVAASFVPLITRAYIYSGYKWNTTSVQVDVSDPSWPSAWISPLAAAMTAWNGASSPFTFSSGTSGHKFTTANNGSGTPLAITYNTHSFGITTDVDTVVNTYYTWSTVGSGSAYDVQNALTHELGHWLSLGDETDSGSINNTMYYSIALGETKKRTLETDDLNGINYIYP